MAVRWQLHLPVLIASLAALAHAVKVEDTAQYDDGVAVKLEQGEEFIVSCSAGAPYQYCKFKSPTGQICNFEWENIRAGKIKQLCVGLEKRVIFVGSYEDHECALLIKGAEEEDGGQWTCEVGSSSSNSQERQPRWSQIGELQIHVIPYRPFANETLPGSTSNTVTMTISKANTALLVVCVLVFVVFVAILVSVVVLYGRRKQKGNTEDNVEVVVEDDDKASTSTLEDSKLKGEMSFMKNVFPHIMSFPNKDPGLNL